METESQTPTPTTPKKKLTDRQQEIYSYIQSRLQVGNLPPTVREIGEHFNISSTNGVRSILSALIKKGYIKRSPKLSRGLELTQIGSTANNASTINSSNEGSQSDANLSGSQSNSLNKNTSPSNLNDLSNSIQTSNTIEIPIIGRVAAGSPIMAVQNLEGTVVVDRDFLMARGDVFALKVQGDSMIEAGIFDGDLVFAKQQNTAETGEMVVAQVEDEATVKYFRPEDDHIMLDPANAQYRPIKVPNTKDFSIAGKVIGVLRRVS